MKSKTLRYFVTILAAWVAVPMFLAMATPTIALADATTDKANQYCGKYPTDTPANTKKNTACVKGYEEGYKPQSSPTAPFCFGYAKGLLHGSTAQQIKNSDDYKACKDGKIQGKSQRTQDDKPAPTTPADTTNKNSCAGVGTFFKFDCNNQNTEKGGNENPIVGLLLTILSWITGLVALAVVGGIIYGGILYTSAQDNASQTQKGITFIVNSVLGLVLWIAAYALLNFIVPGGLFN